MKLLISIFLVFMAVACGHRSSKDSAVVAYYHQQLTVAGLDRSDLIAIQEDLARRTNPDRQAYLDHLDFADRVLESRLQKLPPSNPKAEFYTKAVASGFVTANFLKAQPQ